MPDIGEGKNPDVRYVEFQGPPVDFDGGHQGDQRNQPKVGEDQKAAGPVVPEFDEFYLEQAFHAGCILGIAGFLFVGDGQELLFEAFFALDQVG